MTEYDSLKQEVFAINQRALGSQLHSVRVGDINCAYDEPYITISGAHDGSHHQRGSEYDWDSLKSSISLGYKTQPTDLVEVKPLYKAKHQEMLDLGYKYRALRGGARIHAVKEIYGLDHILPYILIREQEAAVDDLVDSYFLS
tara:strand:+ start:595 stop:1023 length:429 start_codon:yes stop_codon:yes gene_type:complete